MIPRPVYFKDAVALRRWFQKNHRSANELWVKFYKKNSTRHNMTWNEAVDQALCFGWIDGIRKSVDDDSFTNRFTPRREKSTWSAVNIRKVKELQKKGLMTSAGLDAYKKGKPAWGPKGDDLAAAEGLLARKLTGKASAFFAAQAGTYRKNVVRWIASAKKEETRTTRIVKAVKASAEGQRLNF